MEVRPVGLGLYAVRQAAENTWGWDRNDGRRYFVAGGGTDEEFEHSWQRRLNENRVKASALHSDSFHTAGGAILYAVVGRKPQ